MKIEPSLSYRGSELYLLGHRLSGVANDYGTPTYVYCFERVRQKLKILRQSFSQDLHIHYSMKANSHRGLLKKLRREGVGVDVVSGGEIQRAFECGFRGKDIIFSGVGKSVDEIELSLKRQIHIFNIESPQELERIGQLAKKLKRTAQVSFRLNPDVNPVTHPYITTGFRNNKFGMDRSFVPALLKILKKYPHSLNLVGLDFHIGSQLFEIGPFEDAAKKALPLFNNIGGGIGVPYENRQSLDLALYGKKIEKLLTGMDATLLCEPGRFLVADAGVLLTKVEYIKKTPSKNFVIVDTGMHHLLRPALYQAFHKILPVSKKRRLSLKTDVVGPICESSDWLAQNRKMQKMEQDEILAICDTGAYGYVMCSDYNLHEKPTEVLLD